MVKWSETSRKDLQKIYEFIATDSATYGRKLVSSIIRKAQVLNSFPAMGRMVPELANESIREMIISQYRIIYTISSKGDVEILAVIHGKRDFDDAFEFEE